MPGSTAGSEERGLIEAFLDAGTPRPTLALVYGRRRIGKSTLLVGLTEARNGFYFEATRVESRVQLDRLGDALGDHLGVGRLALDGWEDALGRLVDLARSRPTPIVLDEFGYVAAADPAVPSIVAAVLGPGARRRSAGRARLILCGSAVSIMSALMAGQAPLRGRAGVELVMQPDDFRHAAGRLADPGDLKLAGRVYAVIGGVVGYATDMVDFDLPGSVRDFRRWVARRVQSPAATLHHDATTLLAEDPSLAGSSPVLHHSILSMIANGSVTAGNIAKRVGRPVSNLAPALNQLVDAGFVIRHEDPVRKQRPTYALADPYLQFHFAVLDPNRALLRHRDPEEVWTSVLVPRFDSQVRGPVFEEMARTWVVRFASPDAVPGTRAHVGPSTVSIEGTPCQLDVVVADDADGDDTQPSARPVRAIGEAKAGEALTVGHLRHLETARAALGVRAADAKLLLFGPECSRDLTRAASARSDVELVDLDRLYGGD